MIGMHEICICIFVGTYVGSLTLDKLNVGLWDFAPGVSPLFFNLKNEDSKSFMNLLC